MNRRDIDLLPIRHILKCYGSMCPMSLCVCVVHARCLSLCCLSLSLCHLSLSLCRLILSICRLSLLGIFKRSISLPYESVSLPSKSVSLPSESISLPSESVTLPSECVSLPSELTWHIQEDYLSATATPECVPYIQEACLFATWVHMLHIQPSLHVAYPICLQHTATRCNTLQHTWVYMLQLQFLQAECACGPVTCSHVNPWKTCHTRETWRIHSHDVFTCPKRVFIWCVAD